MCQWLGKERVVKGTHDCYFVADDFDVRPSEMLEGDDTC
jgi:hypothetical protein